MRFGDDSFIFHAVATTKLVLRAASELDSARVGNLHLGQKVTVLRQTTVTDDQGESIVRAKVGVDTSPRGVATNVMGWVTMVKAGETKLRILSKPGPGLPMAALSAAAERLTSSYNSLVLDASFFRLDGAESTRFDGESMASRIAKRRQLRRQSSLASFPETPSACQPRFAQSISSACSRPAALPAFPARHGTTNAEAAWSKPVSAESQEAPSSQPTEMRLRRSIRHTLQTSDALRVVHGRYVADADADENAVFDTVGSRLGQLLLQRKVKVADLMAEWDRNHDGAISKQEVCESRMSLPPFR
jgi:hypothetical protein